MRPTKAYVVLAMLLAAGCASSPEVADEAAIAAPSLAALPSSASPSAGTVVPDAVIDANELIASTPAPPICREVLRPNSNVHETLCMSAEHWKLWKASRGAERGGDRALDARRRSPLLSLSRLRARRTRAHWSARRASVGFALHLAAVVPVKRDARPCPIISAVADGVHTVLAFGLTAFRAQKQHLEGSSS